MNIAILHSSNLEKISPGGVTQYVKQLIKYCDNGEITVFGTGDYLTDKIGVRQKKVYAGKEYYFIPISTNKRSPLSIYYFIGELKYLKQLCKYDIIFSQRIEYSIPFIFCKEGRKKLFQIVHGSIKYSISYYGKIIGRICQMLERLSIGIAVKTFVILQREEVGVPYYKKKYKKNSNKILYGKVPIDTKLFRNLDMKESRKILGIASEAKIALYLGRIDNDPKRVFLYPEIVNIIINKIPDFKLFIIGTGEDEKELENIINSMNLSEHIILLGYIEAGDVLSRYISASNCTINISKFEGTCTSTLESIACGRPVVTTDVGDVAKYMPNEQNGIIIPNDDDIIENAAKAICKLLNVSCDLNNIFELYDGRNVIKELKEIFEKKG